MFDLTHPDQARQSVLLRAADLMLEQPEKYPTVLTALTAMRNWTMHLNEHEQLRHLLGTFKSDDLSA